jgi:hypothetical protein
VSASIKDTSVEGLEGINLKGAFPFKYEDYTLGFRHSFGKSITKGPEAVFVRRTFDAPSDSTVTLDAEYETGTNILSIAAKWATSKLGLSVSADGNTEDKLRNVEISTSDNFKGSKVAATVSYDLMNKKVTGRTSVSKEDTTLELSYDTEAADPVLEVSHKVNEENTLAPSISLKTGHTKYGWLRKWEGGSLETTLLPGDKVTMEWTDKSSSGAWKTKASIPVDNVKGSTVTVSRDWKY